MYQEKSIMSPPNSHGRIWAFIISLITWFAVIAQFILMMENRVAPVGETIIRFFTFFTILTNIIVAAYFSFIFFEDRSLSNSFFRKPGVFTAITVYITIVGIVYQLVLRQIWHPEGLQMVVNEILHTLTPLLVIIAWFLFAKKDALHYRMIFSWLIYPAVYLFLIFFRGYFSGYYPYPFMDVNELGLQKVLLNSLFLLVAFSFISFIFIAIAKSVNKKSKQSPS